MYIYTKVVKNCVTILKDSLEYSRHTMPDHGLYAQTLAQVERSAQIICINAHEYKIDQYKILLKVKM